MNFFEQQRLAKKNTWWLLVLFVLAVIIISALTAFALQVVIMRTWLVPTWKVGFVVAAMISLVSLVHTLRMGDGPQIAESLGGALVPSDTQDLQLKKVINVVEEMAIAAGVPIPWLFVLKNDSTINAFAAGFDLGSSAIGITQGAVEHLSRDELQGVIGHELSHIINGDMRLNMYLAGAISGLVMISKFGKSILDATPRSRSRKSGHLGAVGAVLYVFGMLGVFLSRIIQSLISRQREYLADAASAQFTRQPMALASALSKIANHLKTNFHGNIDLGMSHIFFSNFSKSFLSTHPSLEERISRLLPNHKKENIPQLMDELGKKTSELPFIEVKSTAPKSQNEKDILSSVGILSIRHLQGTEQKFKLIHADLDEYVHNPEKSLRLLRSLMTEQYDQLSVSDFAKASAKNRLILMQLALNSLRKLDLDQRKKVFAQLESDAIGDLKHSAVERVLLLMAHDILFSDKDSRKTFQSVESVNQAVGQVLKLICGMNADGSPAPREKYMQALSHASQKMGVQIEHSASMEIGFESIQILKGTSLKYKEKLFQVLWSCVNLDGNAESFEVELLRVICILMRIPVPPILEAQ